jgi:glucose-1-phosphate thymidylyltransferase
MRRLEKIDGEVKDSRIEGRVEVGNGTKVLSSTIRGSSIIGENYIIETAV